MPSLAERFPIIAHDPTGECCGCIVVDVRGETAALVCNECGDVVGSISTAILEEIVEHIAPERNINVPTAECPHCGHVNRFPGWDSVQVFVCRNCGEVWSKAVAGSVTAIHKWNSRARPMHNSPHPWQTRNTSQFLSRA